MLPTSLMRAVSKTSTCSLIPHLPSSTLPSLSASLSTTSPASSLVQTEVDNMGIATVKLARAPVNSLNLELLQELGSTVRELEVSGAKALILTSAQPTVFCSGLDIMEMYKPDPERLSKFWSTFQETWRSLYGSRLPTVAAITGHSPAGGCVLAMSCDYRVMQSPAFKIGMNETALGTGVPYWIKELMVRTVGHRQAELAFQLSILFDPQSALQIGLVDEVAESREKVMEAATNIALKFAAIPSEARHATKMLMRKPFIDDLASRKEADIEFTIDTFMDPTLQKNMGLYLEAMRKKSKK